MAEGAQPPGDSLGARTVPGIDSRLAHELANILAAAVASARLLKRHADTEEATELVEILERQLEKATNAIHGASNKATAD